MGIEDDDHDSYQSLLYLFHLLVMLGVSSYIVKYQDRVTYVNNHDPRYKT